MHSNRTSILAGTCVARGSIWASGPTEPLLRLWLSVIAVWLGLATRLPAGDVALQLATFRVDVTPAVGESPCAGFLRRVDSIEHPLELRGVIFKSGTQTFVIAAIDFCGISNSSDETLRDALARAAGTSRDRVALQSLHQHSAPVLDLEAVRLLHGPDSAIVRQHLEFTETIAIRATQAIQKVLDSRIKVRRIVCSRALVDRVASNRRVPRGDGTIAVRTSLTREPAVRDAPEGLIDPWLRTITFHGERGPLVQLHYYSTHPQTFYGDQRISWDCVGMAREQIQQESGIFQIYFNGCGGNITVGKYNDGTREARRQLADRLMAAMRRSSQSDSVIVDFQTESLDTSEIQWQTAALGFQLREDGRFARAAIESQMQQTQSWDTRLAAAMFHAFQERLRSGQQGQASRLRIGPLDLLHLPGEPFVEYQLFAQQVGAGVSPGSFACVAGYGDCGVWYYGPDAMYREPGGFEQTWSFTGPCQVSVEEAIKTLLRRTDD